MGGGLCKREGCGIREGMGYLRGRDVGKGVNRELCG